MLASHLGLSVESVALNLQIGKVGKQCCDHVGWVRIKVAKIKICLILRYKFNFCFGKKRV